MSALSAGFTRVRAATPVSAPPIQLNPRNPHYFLFRGKTITLVTSGEHYGAVLIPTRVARAKDKPKAEVSVQIAQRWVLAALRHRTFFTLADLNAAIRDRIMAMGAKKFPSAVLCEKLINKSKPLRPDFCGFEVPDRYVFGCGMDAKGYWRNLPTIRALTEGA